MGSSGSGKTTLLRLISDLSKATSGRVLIKGNDVSRSEAWKQYTSSYIDKNFLIDFLTAEEYFEFIAASYNITKHELDISLAGLADFMRGELMNKNKWYKVLLPIPIEEDDPITEADLFSLLYPIYDKRIQLIKHK